MGDQFWKKILMLIFSAKNTLEFFNVLVRAKEISIRIKKNIKNSGCINSWYPFLRQ